MLVAVPTDIRAGGNVFVPAGRKDIIGARRKALALHPYIQLAVEHQPSHLPAGIGIAALRIDNQCIDIGIGGQTSGESARVFFVYFASVKDGIIDDRYSGFSSAGGLATTTH